MSSKFSIRWEASDRRAGVLSGRCDSSRVGVVSYRAYVEIFGPIVEDGDRPPEEFLKVRVSLDDADDRRTLRSIVVPGRADGVEFFDDRISMTVTRISEEWVTQK